MEKVAIADKIDRRWMRYRSKLDEDWDQQADEVLLQDTIEKFHFKIFLNTDFMADPLYSEYNEL